MVWTGLENVVWKYIWQNDDVWMAFSAERNLSKHTTLVVRKKKNVLLLLVRKKWPVLEGPPGRAI